MSRVVRAWAGGLSVMAVAALLTGCATSYPIGSLYTEVALPQSATSNTASTKQKVGVSTCTSVLGLVATGDASIEAAMRNGGITKVHHVDWSARNILGLYGEYKTTVYGE